MTNPDNRAAKKGWCLGSLASVHSTFQDEGLHRLLERVKNSNQMVVLPREVALPGTGDLSTEPTV
jgi:hypothetical protein